MRSPPAALIALEQAFWSSTRKRQPRHVGDAACKKQLGALESRQPAYETGCRPKGSQMVGAIREPSAFSGRKRWCLADLVRASFLLPAELPPGDLSKSLEAFTVHCALVAAFSCCALLERVSNARE